MPFTITAFANNTNPTGPQLDNNFKAMALEAVTPCTVSGTNALTLTQKTFTYTIAAYEQNVQLSGVAVASNAAATTARLGALAFLKVYRDSPAGPVQCTGGEIVIGNAFTLMYDAALDSGAGGWHLFTTTAVSGAYLPLTGGTVTGPINLTGSVSTVGFTAALSATIVQSPSLIATSLASLNAMMVGATAASITRMLSVQATVLFTVASASTTQDQNVAVPGAQLRDVVSLGMPSSIATGVGYSGFVAAAGTVSVRQMNSTTATLASVTHTLRVGVTGFA